MILGISCTYPDTFWAPLFVFGVCIALWDIIIGIRRKLLIFYFIGIGFHASSMWWLMPTVSRFGGFPMWIAFFILVLYCLSSSLQFFFLAYFHRYLVRYFKTVNSFIVSWMLFEVFFPRLFPWGVGNFFIRWRELTAYSELVGERGVSLIVLVLSYLFYRFCQNFKVRNLKGLLVFPFVAIGVFICGNLLNKRVDTQLLENGVGTALLVQGNLSTKVKGDMSYLSANLETYQDLSKEAEEDFIVWPETVFSTWSPFKESGEYLDIRFDPTPEFSKPLIYGSLGYDKYGPGEKDVKFYNAAFLRKADATLGGAYAKRVLMPFGEYVPFSDIFPFLKDIVPIGEGFTVGPIIEPMKLGDARIGMLICYEDLVSDLAREYNRKGANVLLNITNDAWYGDSPASRQHDLLARFRAVETRTYLLRSTNTGFTSVIDPFGKIIGSLPSFVEDTLKAQFTYSSRVTFYSTYGHLPIYGLLVLLLVFGFRVSKR